MMVIVLSSVSFAVDAHSIGATSPAQAADLPDPGTFATMALGLLALGFIGRRR